MKNDQETTRSLIGLAVFNGPILFHFEDNLGIWRKQKIILIPKKAIQIGPGFTHGKTNLTESKVPQIYFEKKPIISAQDEVENTTSKFKPLQNYSLYFGL